MLCALRGPEGLTTVFGQFEGVEQEKIGGKFRNRGEHSEKRESKFQVYTRPKKLKILFQRSEEHHI